MLTDIRALADQFLIVLPNINIDPLVVDPIIINTWLPKVLMDGGCWRSLSIKFNYQINKEKDLNEINI